MGHAHRARLARSVTRPMSFDDPELGALFGLAWGRMMAAPAQRGAAFRTPILATISASRDGSPDARMVVLRKVDRPHNRIEIHTDDRAAKGADIAANPAVALVFWDARHQFQVRAQGLAMILTDADAVDTIWAGLTPLQQDAYRLSSAPGTPVESRAAAKVAGKPGAEAQALRYFQVIRIEIDSLDCLTLDREGHERARFTRTGDDWTGSWTAP